MVVRIGELPTVLVPKQLSKKYTRNVNNKETRAIEVCQVSSPPPSIEGEYLENKTCALQDTRKGKGVREVGFVCNISGKFSRKVWLSE